MAQRGQNKFSILYSSASSLGTDMIVSFFPPMCCHYRVPIFSKAYRQITKGFESDIVKYLKATKHLLSLQRKSETQLLCFERSQAGGSGRGSAGPR